MSQSSNLIPHFSASEAQSLAVGLFGVSATAQPLPSERDQNFLLEPSSGPQFVLKIANADQENAILDAQNAALTHLASQAPELHCPRIHQATTGELIARAGIRWLDSLCENVDLCAWAPLRSYEPPHL